jgi:hypothetical protein
MHGGRKRDRNQVVIAARTVIAGIRCRRCIGYARKKGDTPCLTFDGSAPQAVLGMRFPGKEQ